MDAPQPESTPTHVEPWPNVGEGHAELPESHPESTRRGLGNRVMSAVRAIGETGAMVMAVLHRKADDPNNDGWYYDRPAAPSADVIDIRRRKGEDA